MSNNGVLCKLICSLIMRCYFLFKTGSPAGAPVVSIARARVVVALAEHSIRVTPPLRRLILHALETEIDRAAIKAKA